MYGTVSPVSLGSLPFSAELSQLMCSVVLFVFCHLYSMSNNGHKLIHLLTVSYNMSMFTKISFERRQLPGVPSSESHHLNLDLTQSSS